MLNMEKMIEELKEKKKGKMMTPLEQSVKKELACGMRDVAKDQIKSQLGGMKKVTVAAKDDEGLKKGLEKAEELVEGKLPAEMEEEDEMEEEGEELSSLEAIEAKMKELEELKAKLLKG